MDMVTISSDHNNNNNNNNVVYENYGFYDENPATKTGHHNESKSNCSSKQIAVKIRNVFLNYGNHQVLKGINMNVPVKQIYGLLGPSGCGMLIEKQFENDHLKYFFCFKRKNIIITLCSWNTKTR